MAEELMDDLDAISAKMVSLSDANGLPEWDAGYVNQIPNEEHRNTLLQAACFGGVMAYNVIVAHNNLQLAVDRADVVAMKKHGEAIDRAMMDAAGLILALGILIGINEAVKYTKEAKGAGDE